jgi:NEDD8-activating enzyme E1 regulatory subunit
MEVVETHPEDVVDLRLDCPWPELQRLASTLNLSEMDDFEHGHVPYILILLNFLDQWKQLVTPYYNVSNWQHETPPTMKDRKLLNEMLLKEKRNINEENFDEAVAASFRACRKTEIPNDIQQILQDPKTKNLTKDVPTYFRTMLI